jgi:3-hydroxybutyryl-CoA dehydrogenase
MTAIKSIGIAGAGVMGSDVAHLFARAGYPVVLVDLGEQELAGARAAITTSVRFGRFHSGTASSADVLGRIEFTSDYERFHDVDLVVENVTEEWSVKEAVYRQIDRICPPGTVFAVNTSVIPITRVAAVTDRPDRVIGTHFMNPPSIKPMVEVIRGYHTSEETVRLTTELLAEVGRQSVVVADSPGFVTNRVLMLTVNEAVFLLHEGVASAEQVDRLFKGCFAHRMGPLETADLIGLDTVLRSIELLHESFGDSKYRPCPLLRQMVAAGLHGRKSGRGFYSYDPPAQTDGPQRGKAGQP